VFLTTPPHTYTYINLYTQLSIATIFNSHQTLFTPFTQTLFITSLNMFLVYELGCEQFKTLVYFGSQILTNE